MNSKYEKKKLLNFVEFYTNYMENILYCLSEKKRKKKFITNNTNILNIVSYKNNI